MQWFPFQDLKFFFLINFIHRNLSKGQRFLWLFFREVRLHVRNSQLGTPILGEIKSEDYPKEWIIPKSSVSLLKVWHYLLLLFCCYCWNSCLFTFWCIYTIYIFAIRKSSALTEGTTMPNWPNASWEGDLATSWIATEGGLDIRHAVDWRGKNAHKPQVCVVREKKNSSHCFSAKVITWPLIYLR